MTRTLRGGGGLGKSDSSKGGCKDRSHMKTRVGRGVMEGGDGRGRASEQASEGELACEMGSGKSVRD